MRINFELSQPITTEEFIGLLERSSLSARRPVEDRACMEGMVNNAGLTVTAWNESLLVGVARSITDFYYACYLSDLAVDRAYQGQGIGKRLQELTQGQLGPRCKLILLAAPGFDDYYSRLGYVRSQRCWVLRPEQAIRV